MVEDVDDSRREVLDVAHDAAMDGASFASETTLLWFETDPNATYTLLFVPAMQGVRVARASVTDAPATAPSVGTFLLSYAATTLPPGETPARPAATRDDPHLITFEGNAPSGATDLTAVWLDDARVGDGAFEVRFAARDLRDWAWAEGTERVSYLLFFTLAGQRYDVSASMDATNGPYEAIEDVSLGCGLSVAGGGETVELDTRSIVDGICDFAWDEGVVTVVLPERALGSPAPGLLFTDMRAQTVVDPRLPGTGGYSSSARQVTDEVSGERYAFALGGPDVWDALNPRLAIPREVVPAWYQAPLHRENVPDTLQVGGALLAALTFLAGLVLVRRHRRQTRELLARIDALMAQHEADARAGLVALGALESDITRLYHDGKLNEAQYQVVTQRIAGAASRLALRHGFGLDDGAPGPQSGDGPIAVRVAPESER